MTCLCCRLSHTHGWVRSKFSVKQLYAAFTVTSLTLRKHWFEPVFMMRTSSIVKESGFSDSDSVDILLAFIFINSFQWKHTLQALMCVEHFRLIRTARLSLCADKDRTECKTAADCVKCESLPSAKCLLSLTAFHTKVNVCVGLNLTTQVRQL